MGRKSKQIPERPASGAKGRRTRRRIVEAAYRLFSERGYAETTMAQVAADTGVSVPTVYFSFHNKPALFRAAFDFGVLGDHEPAGPHDRPWFAAFESEPDVRRAIAAVVGFSGQLLRRVTPMIATMQGLADDPELAAFRRQREAFRRADLDQVLRVLIAKRALRAGLSHERALTVLLVMLGPDVYRSFVVEHGWTEAAWVGWTTATVAEALFGLEGD